MREEQQDSMWLELSEQGRTRCEVTEVSRNHIMYTMHESAFYSKRDEKTLESSEQGNNDISFVVQKDIVSTSCGW